MNVSFREKNLYVEPSWWETILAHTSPFFIPLEHITFFRLTTESPLQAAWFGFRKAFFVPFFMTLGTLHMFSGKEFWYKKTSSKLFLIIELKEEKYKKLVFGTEDAGQLYQELVNKLSHIPHVS